MSEKKPIIIAIVGIVVSAVVSIILMVVNTMSSDLEKKADKEIVDMGNRHLKELIGKESESRKDGDKTLNNRVDRIEDREELRNIK